MSFARYPAYKDSGVAWLGEVPAHWEVPYGRRVYRQIREPALASDVQLSATQKYGVIPQADFMEAEDQKVMLALKGLSSFKHVERDDFVISLRSFQGGIEHSAYDGCVSPAYTVLRANAAVVPRFIAYTLKSSNYISALQSRTDGIRDGKNISYDQFGEIGLPLPPNEEQVAIAAFLDRETAKIDALVAEQERLIELLKEKRQAVISHAVTKGLDPSVPMKDSRVEWLGEVPTHWEIRTLRTLSSVVRGASPRPAGDPRFFDGDDTPWVTVGEVTKDTFAYLDSTASCLTKDGAALSRLFRAGTVIYSNSGATLGVPKILRINACANDGIVGFEALSDLVDPLFLFQYLDSLTATIREMVKQGSGQPNLNTDLVKALPISLPSCDEQMAICSYVEKAIDEYGALASAAEEAIRLLQERRAALISAAVTGQIDVREAV